MATIAPRDKPESPPGQEKPPKPTPPPDNPANPGEGCYGCKYLDPSRALTDPDGTQITVGICRRYAPHPVVTVATTPMITLFPQMRPDEWCGEYEAVPPHPAHLPSP